MKQWPGSSVEANHSSTSPSTHATLSIDLEAQTIRGPDGGTLHFDIDPARKHNLLNGLDEIGLTLERASAIDAYEAKLAERGWA